jgi:hypothetical protein
VIANLAALRQRHHLDNALRVDHNPIVRAELEDDAEIAGRADFLRLAKLVTRAVAQPNRERPERHPRSIFGVPAFSLGNFVS